MNTQQTGGNVTNRKLWRLLATVLAIGLVAAACTNGDDDDQAAGGGGGGGAQEEGSVLDEVRSRGELRCGVNDAVPGFGFVDEEGEFAGFDIDYCKAIAAGVLGDPEAVDYRPLTAQQRFTALQSREIDVLVRNTTWTASRDGTEGATFLTTTFYDGQGMMVRADSGFEAIEDMDNTTICVLSGTTTEINLTSRFNTAGVDFEALTFDDNEPLQEAFIAGRCEGWTSDKSQLAGVRSNFPESEGGPEALTVLDETFSKEPLGPVVRDGDSEWAQVVDWIVIATIQAEEFGITQSNVEGFTSDDPTANEFLGNPVGEENQPTDPGLDLDTDFVVAVISAVGNYGEIYERNVGPGTPLGLQRGFNALWTDGGLLYAPPYR